jgi:hypothetical protein
MDNFSWINKNNPPTGKVKNCKHEMMLWNDSVDNDFYSKVRIERCKLCGCMTIETIQLNEDRLRVYIKEYKNKLAESVSEKEKKS